MHTRKNTWPEPSANLEARRRVETKRMRCVGDGRETGCLYFLCVVRYTTPVAARMHAPFASTARYADVNKAPRIPSTIINLNFYFTK
jgi:hypothetical protein